MSESAQSYGAKGLTYDLIRRAQIAIEKTLPVMLVSATEHVPVVGDDGKPFLIHIPAWEELGKNEITIQGRSHEVLGYVVLHPDNMALFKTLCKGICRPIFCAPGSRLVTDRNPVEG